MQWHLIMMNSYHDDGDDDDDDYYDIGDDDDDDDDDDYIPSAISENKVITTAVMAVLARWVFTSEVFITIFVIICIVTIAIIVMI